MIELIEANESVNASFTAMWRAAIGAASNRSPASAPPSAVAS